MSEGLFITFEGMDGCGKTTQIESLKQRLEKTGYEVLVTRAIGGTPVGELIRTVFKSHTKMEAITELMLMSACCAEMVKTVVVPAVTSGKVVLCDRYYESSLAYQGFGRGLDLGVIRGVRELATGDLEPNLTFFLDITQAERRARCLQRGGTDRFEEEDIAFFERVAAGYHDVYTKEPYRIKKLNGLLPIPTISSHIWGFVHRALLQK